MKHILTVIILFLTISVFANQKNEYYCFFYGQEAIGETLNEAIINLENQLTWESSCESAKDKKGCINNRKQQNCRLIPFYEKNYYGEEGYTCTYRGYYAKALSLDIAYLKLDRSMPWAMSCRSAQNFNGCAKTRKESNCVLK